MTEDSVRVQCPPQGQWTREDWEKLPKDDNQKYEIIEGYLYVSTSPSLFHNWIIRRLDKHVGTPAERAGLGYAAIMQAGVFMPAHNLRNQTSYSWLKRGRRSFATDTSMAHPI